MSKRHMAAWLSIWGARIALALSLWQLCAMSRSGGRMTTLLGFPPGAPNPNWQSEKIWYGRPIPWLEVTIRSNEARGFFDWKVTGINPTLLWLAVLLAYQAPPIVIACITWLARRLRSLAPREHEPPAMEVMIPSRRRFTTQMKEGLALGMLLGGILGIVVYLGLSPSMGALRWSAYNTATIVGILVGGCSGAFFGGRIRQPKPRGLLRFRDTPDTAAP